MYGVSEAMKAGELMAKGTTATKAEERVHAPLRKTLMMCL